MLSHRSRFHHPSVLCSNSKIRISTRVKCEVSDMKIKVLLFFRFLVGLFGGGTSWRSFYPLVRLADLVHVLVS